MIRSIKFLYSYKKKPKVPVRKNSRNKEKVHLNGELIGKCIKLRYNISSSLLLMAILICAMALAPVSLQNGSADTFPGKNGRITFVSYKDGNQEIFVMNANGTNQHNISNNPYGDEQPNWSPDGKKIALTRIVKDGFRQIFVMKADGSNQHSITTNTAFLDSMPNWETYQNSQNTQEEEQLLQQQYIEGVYVGIVSKGNNNNTNTIVTINNQQYYMTTLNSIKNIAQIPRGATFTFHNVTYTFPYGSIITPGGAGIVFEVKFPDGNTEKFGKVGEGYVNMALSIPSSPLAKVPIAATVLGAHQNPRAGVTIYNQGEQIKLLVSTL